MSSTLSIPKKEGGISLKMPQQKKASFQVEGRISCITQVVAVNLGFLSSYDWDHREPLVLPQ